MSPITIVAVGAFASIALLLFFLVVQSKNGPILELPMKWLWVSIIPVGISLFVGGFINLVETPLLKVSNTAQSLPQIGADKVIAEDSSIPSLDWTNSRKEIYARTSNIVLTHEYQRSKSVGQEFDVFIYLVRHTRDSVHPPSGGLNEVDFVEFYFGSAWDKRVFRVANTGSKPIGLRTQAYGTFLALCRVHFKGERQPEVIYRYIDFEMARNKT